MQGQCIACGREWKAAAVLAMSRRQAGSRFARRLGYTACSSRIGWPALRDLSLLLDFDDQYRRDLQQDAGFLHRRDRRLAMEHGLDGRGSPAPWLRVVRDRPLTAPATDPRLRTWRRLRWLFVAAGVVLGVMTMLGLLYYDGGRRISVTLIMGVALLQLLLALLTTAQALVGWRPWHGLYQGGLPRWLSLDSEHAPMLRSLQASLAARVAHSGGLAFALAALLTLLTQVLIHDLAFGWSTTLQTSAPALHDLTSALAWPWRAWFPGAVPTLQLVEQSRYFRVGGGTVADPALLGNWWRFLAMLWLCYVVAPRVLLLAFSRVQILWRARRLLATHPGLAAWRERCVTPWVETGEAADHGAMPVVPDGAQAMAPLRAGWVLIRWADAGDAGLARRLLGDDAQSLSAGGSASLEEDAETLRRAAQSGGPVAVATRGWEPPTGDLADFLHDARGALGRTPIQLLPLATGDQPRCVDGATLAQWQRFVTRCHDPALVLACLPNGEHAS